MFLIGFLLDGFWDFESNSNYDNDSVNNYCYIYCIILFIFIKNLVRLVLIVVFYK